MAVLRRLVLTVNNKLKKGRTDKGNDRYKGEWKLNTGRTGEIGK